MMRLARLVPILALALAFACDGATAPSSGTPIGSWTRSESLSPHGTQVIDLLVQPNRRFALTFRDFGVYEGEPATELSASLRYVGSYAVRDDSLVLRPDTLFSYDRFYGASSPTTVRTPVLETLFDHARFEVRGDSLVLDFLSYPADAAVPTRQTFVRER